MNKIAVVNNLTFQKKGQKSINKKDFVNFVAFQFKQLAKKHLKIPIQLYHL